MNGTFVTFASTPEVQGNTLSGYAHVFGTTTMRNGIYHTFAKGAFDDALTHSDPIAVINHDPGMLLGRRSNGTLRVSADAKGLRYEIDLPPTSYADDLKALVARGDIREMSFGISVGKAEWSRAPDGSRLQTHTSVKALTDISPVVTPAFEGTDVQLHAGAKGTELRSQLIRLRHNTLKESRSYWISTKL